ncbi:unnamed protein product [Nezara viridula]|uniref:Large ribosomal subunit protein bL27m n=1 Tax=Nezara viridula TaxID=85310 RepID=A0A9P0HNW9_NEZVI|nr:unnamed protein product [Nezara viridula]
MILSVLTKNLSSNNILTGNGFLSVVSNVLNVRFASKKAGSSTRNRKGHCRPKHRGIHYQDGSFVQPGTMLVTQNKLRCHPGLNVGFGRNGTLFALRPGKVIVTCEKVDLNLNHSWVSRAYGGRDTERIYKKYFHVIPEKQHSRFKLVE